MHIDLHGDFFGFFTFFFIKNDIRPWKHVESVV